MAYIYNTGSIVNGYSVSVSRAVGAKEIGSGKPAENLPTDMMLIHFLLWAIYCRASFVAQNPAIRKITLEIDKTKTIVYKPSNCFRKRFCFIKKTATNARIQRFMQMEE